MKHPLPLHGPCVLVKEESEYSILYCPQLQTELAMADSSTSNKKRRLDGDHSALKFNGAARFHSKFKSTWLRKWPCIVVPQYLLTRILNCDAQFKV